MPDGPLSERGQHQVTALADRLRSVGVSAIHTSTLRRATHTAKLVAERFVGIEVHEHDLLREVIPTTPPAHMLSAELRRFLAPHNWPPGVLAASAERAAAQLAEFAGAGDGGDDGNGDGEGDAEGVTVEPAAAILVQDGGANRSPRRTARTTNPQQDRRGGSITELIVTHGNVIAWFVSRALGAPSWAWITLPTHDYAALSAILDRTGRPPTVLAYNDAGHLPATLRGLELPQHWRL